LLGRRASASHRSFHGHGWLYLRIDYFNPLLTNLRAENSCRHTRAKQTEHGHHVPGRVVCRQDGASSISLEQRGIGLAKPMTEEPWAKERADVIDAEATDSAADYLFAE
jgi:hypothetical protein